MSQAVIVDLPAGPPVSRLTADNASPMTAGGTNSFLIGQESVAIIDPGPIRDAHLEALIAEVAGRPVLGVFVTHSHLDHSPLARPLADRLNAPIFAFGRHEAGRSPTMESLAEQGLGGGEGADYEFAPDEALSDGEAIEDPTGSWRLQALHTPGHTSNHLSFALETLADDDGWRSAALFSGDHVMGWATSIVSPPDGDMGAYMRSLEKLATRDDPIMLPAHGEAIEDPAARLAELTAHRRGREASVLAALDQQPRDAATLTRLIYTDIDERLWPLAERNVLAHLIDLWERGLAAPEQQQISVSVRFRSA